MKLLKKNLATPFCKNKTTTTKNTIKQQIATNAKQRRVNHLFLITRKVQRGEKWTNSDYV